ncbi:MFS transporter [Vibrio diabolicus]|uniref:MFS transporter n=1 Tax=Vibrio diabolicus TaxID=50719 RepID=UPI000CE99140|nr:MFS transporter [Vibrio diabolicus]AVF59239.1 MFS transporter [Vibrio diabolicus]
MTYRYRIALIFLIGFFIDCINIFMSAIALPDIAKELSVSESGVAWVANSYILGLTLIIPLSNWLASQFGARLTMMVSMLIFSLGALLSGTTNEFYSLIIFRFIQGIGGGLLIPVGQALTFNLFKHRERTKISTIIMAVALIAPAVSPGVGGIIVDHASWRWVFLSNIPFSLFTALLALLWIRSEKTQAKRPDLKGLILVSISLATILIGLSIYADASSKLLPVLFLLIGFGFAAVYLQHYRRESDAILDLSVLNNVHMRFSILVYYAVPGVFTGVNLLNIFFLQEVLGWSAERTGLLMLLYAIGSFSAMMISGRLYNRIGATPLFLSGLLLHAAGIAVLSLVGSSLTLSLLIVAYLMMGMGGGVSANTAQTTAMMDFDEERLARASAIWNLNRQMSFSIGAAFFTLIFNLLQQYTADISAYHLTFLTASLTGLIPLLLIKQLNRKKDTLCNPKEN